MTRAAVLRLVFSVALACGAANAAPVDVDAGPPAPADGGVVASPDAGAPPSPTVHTVEGRLASVDRSARTVAVEGPARTVTLEFDRNTSVYLPDRLGTVADLAAGARVRAAYGAERRAYWIEVERRAP